MRGTLLLSQILADIAILSFFPFIIYFENRVVVNGPYPLSSLISIPNREGCIYGPLWFDEQLDNRLDHVTRQIGTKVIFERSPR